RTRKTRQLRWRSRNMIPSCASTWRTRKRRSSKVFLLDRNKKPAERRVFYCSRFPSCSPRQGGRLRKILSPALIQPALDQNGDDNRTEPGHVTEHLSTDH